LNDQIVDTATMPTNIPLRILIVDDERINCTLLQAMLRKMGHESISASSGKEALVLLSEWRPDMVLLDVMMPDMNGYDTARAMRLVAEGQVPIVFLTGLNRPEDIIEGLHAGGDDYLHKPIHYELLQAKINTLHERLKLLSKLSLQNIQLEQYKDRIEEDRNIAVRFMKNLSALDRITDSAIKFHLSQAEDFGGDLIAAARSPNNCLHVLLSDSAGHGLASAFTIMPIVEPFYRMTAKGFEISAIAAEMNKRVRKFVKLPRYVAANIISLDLREQTLRVWNGGCPDTLVLDRVGNITHRFKSKHLPLGVINENDFDSTTENYIFRGNACSVFMCSDGVTELRADQDQDLDLGGMLLRAHQEKDCFNYIIKTLGEELRGQPARDDIALLMVDCAEDLNHQPLVGSPFSLSEDTLNAIDVSEPTIDRVTWKMSLVLTAPQLKTLDVVPFLMGITSSLEVKQDDSTIFLVLSELFNNALDHGVLKLDSTLKDHGGMQDYYEERDSRLQKLDNGQIEIELERLESHYGSWLKIKFRDSGEGFDFKAMNKSIKNEGQRYGRGIKLISSVCEQVEFQGNGSEVIAYLDLNG